MAVFAVILTIIPTIVFLRPSESTSKPAFSEKEKIRRFSSMKKLNDVALKLLAKAAYANAEKEANSACLFIGYQPKMPQKVKELKERK